MQQLLTWTALQGFANCQRKLEFLLAQRSDELGLSSARQQGCRAPLR